MKVGQMLSARQDLLPETWIRELSQLQDAAPSIPVEVAESVIETDFGRPVGELFAEFEREPLAAATIGQVHRAVLADGRDVAVKVQRPGIERRVRVDLDLLEFFAESFAASLPETDFETIVSEVRAAVLSEVDFVAEAEACRTVAAHFDGHPGIVVPAPVDGLCSEHVLTTTFLTGEKLTVTVDRLVERRETGDASAQVELSRLLGLLLEAYLRQVLEVGVFQADPHPGNLKATPDGRIGILDFGCAGRLEPDVKARYLALVGAFVTGDEVRMAELFGELGFRTRSGRPDTLNRFTQVLLGEIRDAVSGGGVKWPTKEQLEERIAGLLEACREDPVVGLPREFILIARVFMTLGGLFARSRPDLDVAVHVVPVLAPALFGSILGMA
jgi:ubiquinone biosynthesis protein